MKILLSPAKSLDFDNAKIYEPTTIPRLIVNSEYLVNKLQKLSAKQIKKLMSVSDEIAALNFERFYNWNFPFNDTARSALFVFTGEAYRGLDANSFSENDLECAQDKLRILSGLYGLLKPSDLILPYRLEMGTSLKVTPKITNLYKYWGTKITDALKEELSPNEVVVNLASNEYSKAVDFKKIKNEVINCAFKEERNGEFKAIMTFAKRARGTMSRFIIQNNLEDKSELKAFDLDGYSYNNQLSSENEYVFTR